MAGSKPQLPLMQISYRSHYHNHFGQGAQQNMIDKHPPQQKYTDFHCRSQRDRGLSRIRLFLMMTSWSF